MYKLIQNSLVVLVLHTGSLNISKQIEGDQSSYFKTSFIPNANAYQTHSTQRHCSISLKNFWDIVFLWFVTILHLLKMSAPENGPNACLQWAPPLNVYSLEYP